MTDYLTPEELQFLMFVKQGDTDKTIEINRGRRMGHTTCMVESATKDDLIIVPNNTNKKYLEKVIGISNTIPIFCVTSLCRFSYPQRNVIYIDQYSYINEQYKLRELNNFLCTIKFNMLVKLG